MPADLRRQREPRPHARQWAPAAAQRAPQVAPLRGRRTLPARRVALRAQGGGRIVQFSSEGGQIAYPGFSLYHATKWGIEGFVEAVAQEVAPFGIDFLLVEPGPTATDFKAGLATAAPMAACWATSCASSDSRVSRRRPRSSARTKAAPRWRCGSPTRSPPPPSRQQP